jgi:hypothetical protein
MGLPSRVLALLQYFSEETFHTSRTIGDKTGISQRTARRWLQSLVRGGYLSVDETQKEHQFYLVDKPRQALSLELPESVREWNPEKLRSWLNEEGYKTLRQAPEVQYVDPMSGFAEPLPLGQRPLTPCHSEPENTVFQGQTAFHADRPHATVGLSSGSGPESGQGRKEQDASNSEGDMERA